MKVSQARSAARIGGCRGGTGGGTYERTNPDYVKNHERELVAQYFQLAPEWRQLFLDGLKGRDKAAVQHAVKERELNAVLRRRGAPPVPKYIP